VYATAYVVTAPVLTPFSGPCSVLLCCVVLFYCVVLCCAVVLCSLYIVEEKCVDLLLEYPPKWLRTYRALVPKSLHGVDKAGRTIMITDMSEIKPDDLMRFPPSEFEKVNRIISFFRCLLSLLLAFPSFLSSFGFFPACVPACLLSSHLPITGSNISNGSSS